MTTFIPTRGTGTSLMNSIGDVASSIESVGYAVVACSVVFIAIVCYRLYLWRARSAPDRVSEEVQIKKEADKPAGFPVRQSPQDDELMASAILSRLASTTTHPRLRNNARSWRGHSGEHE